MSIYKQYDLTLSREHTAIMRGIAIICIAIHNFCHLLEGRVPENESSFNPARPMDFIDRLIACKSDLLLDIFSFVGWYGVPVFVFLSGYGLVMKYEKDTNVRMNKCEFVYNNWKKLIKLLFPAVVILSLIAFVSSIAIEHTLPFAEIGRYFFLLTFVNDLIYPLIPPIPGVYWYFGMAMQLYIFYAWFVYRRPEKWLIWAVIVSILLQIIVYPSNASELNATILLWIRKNCIGWILSFAFGIMYARKETIGNHTAYVVAILSVLLFFLCMFNEITWHITNLSAIVISIIIARWSAKIRIWRSLWIYIGGISASIFVSHPIVRGIVYRCSDMIGDATSLNQIQLLLIYIPLVLIAAIVYSYIVKYMSAVYNLRKRAT